MHELRDTIDSIVLPLLCKPCADVKNAGLCVWCAEHDKSILPQIAQPSYVRDMHRKIPPAPTEPDAATNKAIRRKKRKLERQDARAREQLAHAGERFWNAVNGDCTPSRSLRATTRTH